MQDLEDILDVLNPNKKLLIIVVSKTPDFRAPFIGLKKKQNMTNQHKEIY